MNFFTLEEAKKYKTPYYKIMELNESELKTELKNWSRIDCLRWLKWNDRNGIYLDDECMAEFNAIVSKEEAIELIINQIIQ